MKHALVLLGLGPLAAVALAVRGGCELHLSAEGAITGSLGEISSGQVRGGQGVSSTAFTLSGDSLIGLNGKGCWWTPPTHTLQCDQGQNPDKGFKIGCDGSVSYQGQTTFYECQTETKGQYNIYLMPSGTGCAKITLKADGCHGECAPSSTGSPPPPPSHSSQCPADLKGAYEYPHLIVPVSKKNPGKAYGTQYNGEVSTGDISSIFNFDIPSSDKGKTCSLIFLFPEQKDLETSSYTFKGDGNLHFEWLSGPATSSTTCNNQPGVKKDLGDQTVSPGHSYTVATFDCPAGQTVTIEIGAAGTTYLKYFQDYNPSPIGLYIRKC